MKRARRHRPELCPYVTRGGLKLQFALDRFGVRVSGLIAADLGCHRGGFTDCLLQRGALRVHSVDTGYGILDWKLRNDPRVILHERTNLLHWTSPESVDLAVIDAGWTPQRLSVPAALWSLRPGGAILSLVKPQYEEERPAPARRLPPTAIGGQRGPAGGPAMRGRPAPGPAMGGRSQLRRGVLPRERLPLVMERVRQNLAGTVEILGEAQSPIPGSGGNIEVWLHLRPLDFRPAPTNSGPAPARSQRGPAPRGPETDDQ